MMMFNGIPFRQLALNVKVSPRVALRSKHIVPQCRGITRGMISSVYLAGGVDHSGSVREELSAIARVFEGTGVYAPIPSAEAFLALLLGGTETRH